MPFLRLLCRVQVHSRAAGGACEQCVSDRREHAVPWDEGESGERTAGYEALPITLQGTWYYILFKTQFIITHSDQIRQDRSCLYWSTSYIDLNTFSL